LLRNSPFRRLANKNVNVGPVLAMHGVTVFCILHRMKRYVVDIIIVFKRDSNEPTIRDSYFNIILENDLFIYFYYEKKPYLNLILS